MHEILDDVTPCFHFHAQPLYHNLDIWPCFGHSKEYDFDNLLPECLFYCKNKKMVCYNIICSSSTIVSVKSKLKKSYYTILCSSCQGNHQKKDPSEEIPPFFFLFHTKHFRRPIRHYTHMTILLTNFGTSHVLLPFSPSNQRLRLRKTAVMRVKMSYIYLTFFLDIFHE